MAAVDDVIIEGLTEVEGWETVWLARKDEPVDPAEADKRKGLVYEMLDEPDRLFPLTFRPGKQVAEMLWASQFNGAKVGADTLTARLKSGTSGLIQRHVATLTQK